MRSENLFKRKITVLSGGVGGAKLVLGLARCVPPSQLKVIVNTADDAVFHGLHVSPDLDTTLYTLAGLGNPKTGWGIAGDTFHALSLLGKYGEETWFSLGDRDLGTHLLRTKLLREGETLSRITALLARKLNVRVTILPMADERVETRIELGGRWVPFQDYFVRRQAKGRVTDIRFEGIRKAAPTRSVMDALKEADLIVIAPSNPVVSIFPILSLPGFRGAMRKTKAFKVAVSPFVGNRAISGPAGELMKALAYEGSPSGLAKFYSGIIDLLVIDEKDKARMGAIEASGVAVRTAPIVMQTLRDKIRLAQSVIQAHLLK